MSLYRTMVAATDSHPQCGTGNAHLGVRPGDSRKFDVQPDADGYVHPGGGMSTFAHPKHLPRFLRPESLGGMSRLPVFGIQRERLELFNLVQMKKHVQVEPREAVLLEQLLDQLCKTRIDWTRWKDEP
jgi:hypothetical protein